MILLKAQITRKKIILPNLFFVNWVGAGTSNSLQYLIWLNSRTVKIYSVVQSVKYFFGFKYICTLVRIKQREKEMIISIFIAGSSLIMATPREIYDTVFKTIILNVFKYLKKNKT